MSLSRYNLYHVLRTFAFAGLTLCIGAVVHAQTPAPIKNLTPSQEQISDAPSTPGTIPLGQAMERKPLRFIEVGDLPPPSAEVVDPNELVDPNSKPVDENFISNELTKVSLRGILKLTGRAEALSGNVGDVLRLGDLEIVVHKCNSVMDQGEQGAAALVEIIEFTSSGAENALFRGWLFSTSPSLSSIGHPQYDVLLQSCQA